MPLLISYMNTHNVPIPCSLNSESVECVTFDLSLLFAMV